MTLPAKKYLDDFFVPLYAPTPQLLIERLVAAAAWPSEWRHAGLCNSTGKPGAIGYVRVRGKHIAKATLATSSQPHPINA